MNASSSSFCNCISCPGAGCACGCAGPVLAAAPACDCAGGCACEGAEQGCLCR